MHVRHKAVVLATTIGGQDTLSSVRNERARAAIQREGFSAAVLRSQCRVSADDRRSKVGARRCERESVWFELAVHQTESSQRSTACLPSIDRTSALCLLSCRSSLLSSVCGWLVWHSHNLTVSSSSSCYLQCTDRAGPRADVASRCVFHNCNSRGSSLLLPRLLSILSSRGSLVLNPSLVRVMGQNQSTEDPSLTVSPGGTPHMLAPGSHPNTSSLNPSTSGPTIQNNAPTLQPIIPHSRQASSAQHQQQQHQQQQPPLHPSQHAASPTQPPSNPLPSTSSPHARTQPQPPNGTNNAQQPQSSNPPPPYLHAQQSLTHQNSSPSSDPQPQPSPSPPGPQSLSQQVIDLIHDPALPSQSPLMPALTAVAEETIPTEFKCQQTSTHIHHARASLLLDDSRTCMVCRLCCVSGSRKHTIYTQLPRFTATFLINLISTTPRMHGSHVVALYC